MEPSANRLPPSLVLACGALGAYDRERALAIAAAMGAPVTVVHEDSSSILSLDRTPVRWRGARRSGFAWSERVEPVSGQGLATWSDAATVGAACGLVVEGRRRYVHSSVSGSLKVYYVEHDGAVYFATRIDPLVSTASGRLSPDWDAWSSILTLDYPLGDRTPFAEIRALPPFARLGCRRGRARVSEERWPWAEVEPSVPIESGTRELLQRLRDAVGCLPAGPIACQLSGGWDSRLCLALLAERRRADTFALTVDHDGGTDAEIRVAAELADLVGVPHEVAAGRQDDYWHDLVLRADRVDFQLVRQPWRVPEIAPLRQAGAPVVDGYAFDTLAALGERFFTRAAIAARGNQEAARELWRRMKSRQAKRGPAALDPMLARALWASSRRQLLAESRRFQGHPHRALLTFYRSRAVRGIALSVYATLGAELAMASPFLDDEAARATLAIAPEDKFGGGLYRALFAALEPGFAEVPSTSMGGLPPGRRLPRRSQSAAAAEAHAACLSDGPLAPFVRPKVHRVLARHRAGVRNPRVPHAVLGPAVFHLWHGRYRDRLGEVDPRELLE